ncbi:MAG: Hsp20/alpha crystallin family protein [Magnetospirillum sp.]|nr:Hsp20/alpha crystallin family protein [Magnetospirillum sp.]
MAERQPMTVKREAAPTVRMGGPLSGLRDEIDRLFEDFVSWSPWRGMGIMRGMGPAADFIEKDDSYEIDLDVPGMEKDNIEIALSDGSLMVRCKVEEEEKEEAEEYVLCERRHEAFARSFDLPSGVDAEHIEAELKNGVLSIMLPKTAEAQRAGRRIEVKTH